MQNKEYEYLDLLGKGLDPYQEKACCRTENTIIAAGAGSGKTQVLASRLAWLVMSKNIPANKILTLTFTNKAAAEMYQRIYQSLVDIILWIFRGIVCKKDYLLAHISCCMYEFDGAWKYVVA